MNTLYGLHNALTAYKPTNLIGKLFNFFSKCQDKSSLFREDVKMYDLQIAYKDGKWVGSHGFVWYNITIYDFLKEVIKSRFNNNPHAIDKEKKILIRLGYDNHYGIKRYDDLFADLANELKIKYYNYINIYQVWNEKGYTFLYNDTSVKIYERYWTISGAKEQVKKDWKKFYLLLPLPKLWQRVYRKQWEEEFKNNSYSNIWMTDFV